MGLLTIGKTGNDRLKNTCSYFSIIFFHSIIFFLFLLALPVPNVLQTGDALAATINPPANLKIKVFSYYVDAKTGNDANAGSIASPFKSIQKAADMAKPGANILIKEGVYKEFITIKQSGTASTRITFEGERGPNGEYKTIIDPSTAITGWSQASEVGQGVYKKSIGFDPREMTVNEKRIGRINDKLMGNGSGFEMLARASDAEVEYQGTMIKFWDGIEVLYGYKDGVTYLRFRGSDDPNQRNIKTSPSGTAITVQNAGYNTISDLKIRGAERSIEISGSTSVNNIIENSHLSNGNCRILIEDGPSNTVVKNNTITMNYIAPLYLGAGQVGGDYTLLIKRHVYDIFKNTISSKKTSDDVGVRIINAGQNNLIDNNHIFSGLLGISGYTRNVSSPTNGLIISNNSIHNMSSVGITSSEGIVNAEYYGNYIYDCNINIRLHNINKSSDIGRKVYIYNNRLYNPTDAGYHIYVHNAATTSPKTYPQYFIYQNSISDGRMFIGIMTAVASSGGMPKTFIINNIISVTNPNDARLQSMTAENRFGILAYNWFGGKLSDTSISKYGSTNIYKKNQYMWQLSGQPNYFDYSGDVSVLKGGLNLLQPFSPNNDEVLPGMTQAYSGKAKIPLGCY